MSTEAEDGTAPRTSKGCIYKVPVWLKNRESDGDTMAYTPEFVSLGPYHRGQPHLLEMDSHKQRCLDIMLIREEQKIELYHEETKKIEAEARACYAGKLELTSDEFVEMLVLDGCFTLEFLRINDLGLVNLQYADDDPIFSKDAIRHVIARDMIKLENQIPLIVLHRLLELQFDKHISDRALIPKLVLRVLTSIWVKNEAASQKQVLAMRMAVTADIAKGMLHCLDIFRWGLLYKPTPTPTPPSGLNHLAQTPVDGVGSVDVVEMSQWENPRENDLDPPSDHSVVSIKDNPSVMDYSSGSNSTNSSTRSDASVESYIDETETGNKLELMVYSVVDLRAAGVKFKTRKNTPFWDVSFDKHSGLLEIPPIKIDDATKTVFLNLIAYEQCHLRSFREMVITDYVAFMDNLVNSESDISYLHQVGIIVHQLGSHGEVADLFNRLVKNAYGDKNEGALKDVYQELNMYCGNNIHKWVAYFRRNYVENPFLVMSILAAILLFLLTIVQAFYAVFAYHLPPKPR